MQPSSTGVLLGLPALVFHPSSVLPSKSRTQPSAFSFSVSSLSAAAAPRTRSARARRNKYLFIAVHPPLLSWSTFWPPWPGPYPRPGSVLLPRRGGGHVEQRLPRPRPRQQRGLLLPVAVQLPRTRPPVQAP